MSGSEPGGEETSVQKNGPANKESDDLRAIKRDRAAYKLIGEFWRRNSPPIATFADDLTLVAMLAPRWADTPLRLRLRALRKLSRRLSIREIRYMADISAEKSERAVRLTLRERRDSEFPDGGKSKRERIRDYWDARIAEEVHLRMMGGESKRSAKKAVMKSYQAKDNDGIWLSSSDAIEHRLKRASKNARDRGYLNPLAPTSLVEPAEPRVKVSDLTKRGAPRKK